VIHWILGPQMQVSKMLCNNLHQLEGMCPHHEVVAHQVLGLHLAIVGPSHYKSKLSAQIALRQ
jgi:hypothetical protein